MQQEIDYKTILVINLEINDRIKLITDIFPESKEFLLKHVAAASLHMALFAEKVVEDLEGVTSPKEKYEEDFLDACGCKDK